MADFNSRRFKRSLEETTAWCESLSLHSESAEIHRRRALLEQTGQLFRQASERANHSLFGQKASETKEWQRAMTLLQDARNSLGPLEHQLRSAALRPTFDLDELNAPWADAVGEVVAKRSQLVREASPRKAARIDGGRLLLYVPTENLADGAAQASSCGFFDVNNVPPWDTWVDFTGQTLVSWVPSALVEAVQMGIDVNPEACIRWAN